MSRVLRGAGVDELALLLDGGGAGTGQTAGLAALAARLRTAAPETTPGTEFRTALRQRLVAVASVQAAVEAPVVAAPSRTPAVRGLSWGQSRTAQRRLGFAAGAMASVVVVSGITVASVHSLPGQPFYAAKRAGESVQLDLVHGDKAKGAKHLDFAATRLREVTALAHGDSELSLGAPTGGALAGGSRSTRVADALRDMDSETRAGRDLLVQAYRSSGDTGALQVLSRFSLTQQVGLTAVRSDLPADVQQQVSSSLALVTTIGADADALLSLGACTSACDPAGAGPAPSTSPGATPVPSNNGVPPCTCVVPSVEPTPTDAPTQQPTTTPTAPVAPASTTPSPSPTTRSSATPSPTASPTPTAPFTIPTLPVPLPTLLPIPVPTALPTSLPLPSLPPLP